MKNIYISIISHNQQDLVIQNFKNIQENYDTFSIKLSIIDNTGSSKLKDFCIQNNIFYFYDGKTRGFGQNHNKMFELLNPKDDDLFIICNPDISISTKNLLGLIENFYTSNYDMVAPRSYLDKKTNFLDYPDRYFPHLANFFISILTGKRLHYGTNTEVEYPQWLSGSFIIFKPKVFKNLNGFDERYFMYCEDIDLCFRAKKAGFKLKLDKEYFIEHNSQMHSRNLFSKNIFWHINSAFRFSIKHHRILGLTKAKS